QQGGAKGKHRVRGPFASKHYSRWWQNSGGASVFDVTLLSSCTVVSRTSHVGRLDKFDCKEYSPCTPLNEGRQPVTPVDGAGAAPAGMHSSRMHSGCMGAPPGVTRDPCREPADRRFLLVGRAHVQSAAPC